MAQATKTLPPPGAVLFDYGETLVCEDRIDRVAGTARLLELATDRGGRLIEEVVETSTRLWADHERRRCESLLEVSITCFQRLLYESLGISFDLSHEQLAREFWEAAVSTSAMPGAAELLAKLAEDDVPIGVVSNTAFGTEIVHSELARHGLDRHLRFVIGSTDYGVRKPHPALFQLAASKLDIATERIWFVGDSLEYDVTGAKSVGMTAIWLNRAATPPDSRIAPDATIESLAQLGRIYRDRA
jgi:HAD superfamily hydrolase (TIGR01662 family)